MYIRKKEISFLLNIYLIVAVFLSPVSLFAQSMGGQGSEPQDTGLFVQPTTIAQPTQQQFQPVEPTTVPVQQIPQEPQPTPVPDNTPIYVETENNTTVNINDPKVEIILTNSNGELDAKVLMPNDAQHTSTIADSSTPQPSTQETSNVMPQDQNSLTTTTTDNSPSALVPPPTNESANWPTLIPNNMTDSSVVGDVNDPDAITSDDDGFIANINNFVNDTFFDSTPSEVQTLVDESQGFTAATQTLAGVLAGRIQSSIRENSQTVIEQHLATYKVEVEADTEGNVVLSRNNVPVTSAVPLVYNAASQTFSVRMDDGDKQILFFPDTVELSLINNREMNSDISMTLGVEGSELIYRAEGCQKEYFAALIPVCPDKTVTISARTNEVTNMQQSFFSRIIDAVSIGA